MLEFLENRRLLSASLSGGVLTITGALNNDLINVTIVGSKVSVNDNGAVTLFSRAAVTSLNVSLRAGNDNFRALIPIRMTIDAGSGDDRVTAGNLNDTIQSGSGNDSVWGAAGADVFLTGSGSTTIFGNEGNDTLRGGGGADLFYGGKDSDTVDYFHYSVAVTVGIDTAANDGAEGEGDNIALDVERIVGTRYADRITGGKSIKVEARAGDDTLMAGSGDSRLYGGDGNDKLAGMAGNDILIGGTGDDGLNGGTGNDEFYGEDGSDTVAYGQRQEELFLSISGVAESGAAGEADLIAPDIEILRGGSANDLMIGSDRPETFFGAAGNDTIDGGWGNDTLWGGSGIDTGDYSSRTMLQQLRINEGTGIPGEQDIPHDDIEVLIGGSGDDWIQGGDANNLLIGNGGSDTIIGMGGNDTLIGGEGADLLGHDALEGGPSAADGDAGNDVIYSFDMTGDNDGSADRISDIRGTNTLHYSLTDPDAILS